eukprot:3746729-Amphidinium_carterae.1
MKPRMAHVGTSLTQTGDKPTRRSERKWQKPTAAGLLLEKASRQVFSNLDAVENASDEEPEVLTGAAAAAQEEPPFQNVLQARYLATTVLILGEVGDTPAPNHLDAKCTEGVEEAIHARHLQAERTL